MRNHLIPFIGALLWAGAVAAAEEERVLPRNMTILEQLSAQEDVNAPGYYIWECFPELAGFTDPPPVTSRFPTEGEQTRGVMYGWPSYGGQMSPLTELIRNSVQQDGYETTVIVPSLYRGAAENTLRARGFDDDMISRINWYIAPLNGIWIRDYGPEIQVTPEGDFQFVDMGYYSGQIGSCPSTPDQITMGRPSDDISPTRFAPSFLKTGVDVFRPQLRTEGGNLQTDGQGTCVHMRRDVLQQNNFSRWRYTQDELDDVYRNFFNCSQVITLNSLAPDPGPVGVRTNIDHVDMIVAFQSAQTVIVGRLDPEDAEFDPTNAAILESNAQILNDAGYNVVRIPMPARYCTVHHTNTCIANPNETRECAPGVDRVWATYTNSILIGNRMLVPIYQDPYSESSPLPQDVKDRIQRQEAEALDTFQTTLDAEYGKGAITVVPVVSDDMIPCLGSMHCISMTYGPPPL
jgi:agmatine/peptidylarginine deiminase